MNRTKQLNITVAKDHYDLVNAFDNLAQELSLSRSELMMEAMTQLLANYEQGQRERIVNKAWQEAVTGAEVPVADFLR